MKKVLTIIFLVTAINNLYSQNLKSSAAKSHFAEQVDMRKLVSEADLVYSTPVERSEEGMPTGNGRMGSLVWTSPTSIKMQINRVDVFGNNKATNSFNRRHTDYASGCGYVDLNMLDYGNDIFAGKPFRQHLGLYDGLMTLDGKNISARILTWHERDVMAIEIDDQRNTDVPFNVDLRMLRYMMGFHQGENFKLSEKHAVKVQTVEQTATSQLDIRNGRIILTQEFRENEFYNASAVAISIVDRESQPRYLNEHTVQLSVKPGKGKFTVLISSASSFDPGQDVGDLALKELILAEGKGFEGLLASNKAWWNDFWSKSYVQLHSEDGEADFVEKNYTYFQYVMASSSQGAYPPRFGGMLWYTTGDMRMWGSQYWWYNQSCYYNALPPTNRIELMDPLFSMYSRHYDSYALAAIQQWGSKGIWLPETTWFDGQDELPEDIAAEMRHLYLLKKPWEQRSERFRQYAETKHGHSARWNWATGTWNQGHWIVDDKGVGPFGHVTHILSATPQIAYLYWLRYEYSQDKKWLQEFGYPIIKGAVEFYRNFPNVRKEADGKYHIYHTNAWEGIWNAHNSLWDISAIRGITPILIRASEILGIDADMRPVWKEFAENIAPMPTNDILSSWKEGQPRYWIGAVPSEGKYPGRNQRPEDPWLVKYFDLCTIGTEDPELISMCNSTFDATYKDGINEYTSIHTLDQNATVAAYLGRADDIKYMIPNQIRSLNPGAAFCDWEGGGRTGVLPNRLTLREGPGAIGCERLGNAATALHAALLQSVPPRPGGKPAIYLFPAWPKEWDASFKLLARGNFLVSTSMNKGEIEYVTIESKSGGECLIKNPWLGSRPMIYRNGEKAGKEKGEYLRFDTSKGEIIKMVK